MGLDLVGLCVYHHKKRQLAGLGRKGKEKKITEVEVPLGSFCISCNSRQGRWVAPEQGAGTGGRGPIAIFTSSSGFYIQKRCFFSKALIARGGLEMLISFH